MRDVALGCDDNGAKFLRVVVHSLLAHYRGAEPIRINVFEGYGGHSNEEKRLMAEIVARYPNATLRYVNVEPVFEPYLPILRHCEGTRWSAFVWTQALAPALLPDVSGNLVHFDYDTLVNDDISPLFEMDLGDDLIAGVAEYDKWDPAVAEDIWRTGILPPEAERSFNAGVLVFNMAKCREVGLVEKLVAWYRDHSAVARRLSQDALNAVCWNRVRWLPLRWNFHDRLIKSYPRRNLRDRYWQGNPPSECLDAAMRPAILHFWGKKKPWKPCHRPYRGLYHEAMQAVGLRVPREPVAAVWHNFVNTLAFRRVSRMLEKVDPLHRRRMNWRRRERVKRIKHAVETPFAWVAVALGVATIGVLPHAPMLKICDLLSSIYYVFDRRGRRFAADNLNAILLSGRVSREPTARERRLIIRRSYRNMARTVGHAFWTMFSARHRVGRVGEMAPEVRRFLAANKPAVTVSGHIGCWEILSQLALLEGHRMMSVAKDIGTKGMTGLLMRARSSIGQEIVSADGAFKALMGGIREGKSLGLLVDQKVRPKQGGVWVRFFGRLMPVSAAPAFFSAKAKAPVITAWSRPLRDGRYRCELIGTYGCEASRDIWSMTQRCTRDLERVIRRHPSCWILNYNYFSHAPTAADVEMLESREREVKLRG